MIHFHNGVSLHCFHKRFSPLVPQTAQQLLHTTFLSLLSHQPIATTSNSAHLPTPNQTQFQSHQVYIPGTACTSEPTMDPRPTWTVYCDMLESCLVNSDGRGALYHPCSPRSSTPFIILREAVSPTVVDSLIAIPTAADTEE